jgi:hypothetical protein
VSLPTTLRSELRGIAQEAQLNLVAERGLLVEAQVLEILAELMGRSQRPVVPVSEIATGLIERYGEEYERPITNRWVGSILRKRLNIRTYKSHGVYVVPMQERSKIELLYLRTPQERAVSPLAWQGLDWRHGVGRLRRTVRRPSGPQVSNMRPIVLAGCELLNTRRDTFASAP